MDKDKKIIIKYLDPKTLIPYGKNAKLHPPEQISKIAGQIHSFGFDQPIVVDKDLVIIKGHGRTQASIQLNLKEVPVIVADWLDEYQAMAARIADNKVAESDWDMDFLKFDLGTLNLNNFNLDLTGFDTEELNDLLRDLKLEDFKSETLSEKEQEKKLEESIYTSKIEVPIYEPTREKPKLEELFNLEKTKSLIEKIKNSNTKEDLKEFLIYASYRHIVFNYENIAEYYAHSNKEEQQLFEESALVIIDYNKALENGFIELNKKMHELIESSDNKEFNSEDEE